ncbi:sulfite exporter TauE/SafE family protein [Actinocorallia longicatena]|uniref:Probable membrane transporter protein n=1 Tax=Actinocorallia longicatena TaxID=111803 RepID=A0ABP6Q9W6_9ACTN
MTPWEGVAIFAAGVGAGGINAVVGSGSLITFPTLLALGYPPVLANVSNNIGLVPGAAAGTYGYRRELAGQWNRVLRLGAASLIGALVGGILLLALPEGAFKVIVPVLIVVALVLVVLQPKVGAWVQKRRKSHQADGGPALWIGVLAAGVYGGYFGAAQGILLISLLGIFLADDMQTVNGIKNALAGIVNATAAILFVLVADVDWAVVALIAAGATIGGSLGARVGRRLPPWLLRTVIVCVGLTAIAKLLFG